MPKLSRSHTRTHPRIQTRKPTRTQTHARKHQQCPVKCPIHNPILILFHKTFFFHLLIFFLIYSILPLFLKRPTSANTRSIVQGSRCFRMHVRPSLLVLRVGCDQVPMRWLARRRAGSTLRGKCPCVHVLVGVSRLFGYETIAAAACLLSSARWIERCIEAAYDYTATYADDTAARSTPLPPLPFLQICSPTKLIQTVPKRSSSRHNSTVVNVCCDKFLLSSSSS